MKRNAFTLLEMLVAMAVFALLAVIIAQMISSSGDVISRSRKHLDSAGQARLILDRVGMDMDSRIVRDDLPDKFSKNGGNDSIEFYGEVPSYQEGRKVTKIGYRVQQDLAGREYQVERGVSGFDWTGANSLGMGSSTFQSPQDSDYEVLADAVFRMEFCYLRKSDGELTNIRPSRQSDIAAIVVAVAILDGKSRNLVSTGQLRQLADALPDCAEGSDPMTTWRRALAQPDFADGAPLKAIQSIDVYQRSYSNY